MSHYDITQWADFVRGVVDSSAAAAMRQHLESGCEPCGAIARRLGTVARAAEADSQYEPPAHLLRIARAAFSLQRPERVLSLPRLVGRLAFDSLETAFAPGTRGPVEEVSRQTLYEVGDFSVHLRFEQPSGRTLISLTGQIANRRVPEPPIAYVPVVLTRGRTVVARGLSNQFGEFRMEYEVRGALRLHLLVSGGRQSVCLALNDSPGGRPGAWRPALSRKGGDHGARGL